MNTPPIQFAHVPSRSKPARKRIFVACSLLVIVVAAVALI